MASQILRQAISEVREGLSELQTWPKREALLLLSLRYVSWSAYSRALKILSCIISSATGLPAGRQGHILSLFGVYDRHPPNIILLQSVSAAVKSHYTSYQSTAGRTRCCLPSYTNV